MIRPTPLWWNADDGQGVRAAPPERSDVVVVGGGITGLAAALHLRRHGRSVTVLDAQPVGHGASGRAFGSIAIGCSSGVGALAATYGPARAEAIWRESSDAAQWFAGYLREQAIECDYHAGGHIRLAACAAQEPGLRADLLAWRRLLPGQEIHLVDAPELRREFPGDAFRLGLLDESSAAINPYKFLCGLMDKFVSAGGVYAAPCEASALRRRKDGFVVAHAQGETACSDLLIATNGHTDDLVPWLRRRVFAIGSYMIATAPLPADLRAAFGARRRTASTAFQLKNYFRLDGAGRLIFGGRANLTTGLVSERIAAELRAALLQVFPTLRDVPVTHAWGGNLGFTFDQIPHLGVHDGIHYAGGYCGRGLPMATLFGRRIAARMLEPGKTGVDAFDDLPPPRRWFYRRRAWFLPLVSMWYRRQDERVRRSG